MRRNGVTTEANQTLFENIIKQSKLGQLLTKPTVLSGGLLHQTNQIQTTTGM